MDFATKRLLYFLGLKGNLQGIASVAHPQLAVSADYRFNAIQCISLTCDEEYGCTESWKACAYSAGVGGGVLPRLGYRGRLRPKGVPF